MKTLCRMLLAWAGLLLAAGSGHAQTINVDAVTRYWEITAALRQDQPLTDQAWRDFLELPGNKHYVSGIYDDATLARYRRAIEVTYMPRHDSLRQARLKANSWFYVLVNDYKQHEKEYKDYLAETVAKPGYLDLMYTLAYQYLPARNHTKVADLKIYYGAIGNDATAQEQGVFYSVRAAINNYRVKPGILEAHEMHHLLRTSKDFGAIAADDNGLMQILGSIQNEGIPDLIDKKPALALPGDPMGFREWALDGAPTAIHRLDSTIQARARGGAPASLKFYRSLSNGSNGHLPGCYMSAIIEKNGYGPRMIATADDPFAFLALYQKAAKKDPARPPCFSAAAVRYLKQLERKYIKPTPAAS